MKETRCGTCKMRLRHYGELCNTYDLRVTSAIINSWSINWKMLTCILSHDNTLPVLRWNIWPAHPVCAVFIFWQLVCSFSPPKKAYNHSTGLGIARSNRLVWQLMSWLCQSHMATQWIYISYSKCLLLLYRVPTYHFWKCFGESNCKLGWMLTQLVLAKWLLFPA